MFFPHTGRIHLKQKILMGFGIDIPRLRDPQIWSCFKNPSIQQFVDHVFAMLAPSQDTYGMIYMYINVYIVRYIDTISIFTRIYALIFIQNFIQHVSCFFFSTKNPALLTSSPLPTPDLSLSDLERGVLIGRNLDEEEESHHAYTSPGSIVGLP